MTRRYTPRHPTLAYQGTQRFSWTICTYLRRPLFTTADVVSHVTAQFSQASDEENIAILAYCFMPDHVHLLIEGRQESSCAVSFVTRAKQRSGFWFGQDRGGRLWQKSSWDRALRAEEDTWTVIKYILMNPVRAGLVVHPMDHPYSGSLVYTREQLMSVFFSTAG